MNPATLRQTNSRLDTFFHFDVFHLELCVIDHNSTSRDAFATLNRANVHIQNYFFLESIRYFSLEILNWILILVAIAPEYFFVLFLWKLGKTKFNIRSVLFFSLHCVPLYIYSLPKMIFDEVRTFESQQSGNSSPINIYKPH